MDRVNQHRRSAATEDDGLDQIGVDSPRSGIATPQPDLHDKRLPGIMSYFNQVRASSLQRFWPGSSRTNGQSGAALKPDIPSIEAQLQAATLAELPPTPVEPVPWTGSTDQGPLLLPHEMLGPVREAVLRDVGQRLSYPTPPTSQPSSLRNFPADSCSLQQPAGGTPPVSRPASLRHLSISDLARGKARRSSLLAPLTTMVHQSSVSALHLSNPAGRASTVPSSPSRAHPAAIDGDDSLKSASMVNLEKKLTATKSGASTPTRALSTARPSRSEAHEEARQRNGDRIDRTATSTPTPPGARAPAAKGKLTIKITEARGLRNCQDPYVVVVFQRSELISSGPRAAEDTEGAAISAVNLGAMPMRRQTSDSGRSMAIPMRSRQSSNTSVTDFNTFRNRNPRRSFTSPKWDAEAIL